MVDSPDTTSSIGVLCVDDNEHVADALRIQLDRTSGLAWKGWLASADDLVERVLKDCPTIVLLDIDMPGKDPFDAMKELADRCPDARVVMFTGHVRRDLIEKAVEAGAWGYVSKNDGEASLVDAVRRVAKGEFAFSPEARASYG